MGLWPWEPSQYSELTKLDDLGVFSRLLSLWT